MSDCLNCLIFGREMLLRDKVIREKCKVIEELTILLNASQKEAIENLEMKVTAWTDTQKPSHNA